MNTAINSVKLSRMMTVFAVLALILAAPAWSQPDRPEFVEDEFFIKFRDGVGKQRMAALLNNIQASTLTRYRLNAIHHVRIPPAAQARIKSFVANHPEIAYIERNYYRYLDVIPGDPGFGSMWGLDNNGQTGGTVDADIDAPEAWNITTGNPDLVIAVIDSGLDLDHPDIAGNLWVNVDEIPNNLIDDDGNGYVDDVNGWDFSNNDNDPTDDIVACGGHGTHTAGTVGAVGDNGIGVTGVNWNVKIMPLKASRQVLLIFCSLPDNAIIEAIEYAAANGAMLSNNSYGGPVFSQVIMDTIRASRRLFVAAAGNETTNNDISPSYPASYPLDNIVSVAATDDNDNLASFSNFGSSTVDLSAPGVNILSTVPDDQYDGSFSGTSMASPHVAGAAGLLLADDPSLTPNELKWKLLKGTDFIGIPVATQGRLNAFNALTLPGPSVTIDVTPLSATSVAPGDTISYQVTLVNTSGSTQTVDASVVAVQPNGNEFPMQDRSLSIGSGQTLSADFTQVIPLGALAGEYHLLGRAEVASSSFDEDLVVYSVAP